MKLFLTLKHWQAFFVLFVLPFLLIVFSVQFVLVVDELMALLYLIPLIALAYIFLCISWIYTLGLNLYKIRPQGVNLSLKTFKVCLLIPAIYIFLIAAFLIALFSTIFNREADNLSGLFIFLIPFHFLAILCVFYCMYFIAKALKTAEWQKPARFGDFTLEFFLIWFFPLGIFVLQPRINQLFSIPPLKNGESE